MSAKAVTQTLDAYAGLPVTIALTNGAEFTGTLDAVVGYSNAGEVIVKLNNRFLTFDACALKFINEMGR